MKRRWIASAFFLSASIAAFAQQQPQPQQRDANNNPAGGWRRVEDPAAVATTTTQDSQDEQQQQQQQPQSGRVPYRTFGNNNNNASAPRLPVPDTVVVPAGTWVTVRTDQLLSSDFNQPGDAFAATLAQPIVANGVVIARRGQTITGRITDAVKAGRVKGTSRLGIEISELGLADGQQLPVRTQLVEFSAGSSKGRDAATVGSVTGVGAAIGGAAAGGFGAGMGAIAGAGASAIGVLLGRGRVTEVPPESIMRFRLLEPVNVDTTRSQQAFQTVQQNDYENGALARRVQVRQQPAYFGGGGWGPYYSPWGWGPGFGWGWGPSVFIGGGRGFYGGGYRGFGGRGRR